eukprot:1439022-Amphidinium_carterae.1
MKRPSHATEGVEKKKEKGKSSTETSDEETSEEESKQKPKQKKGKDKERSLKRRKAFQDNLHLLRTAPLDMCCSNI